MKKSLALLIALAAVPTTAHAEAFNGAYIGAEIGSDNFELRGEALEIDVYDVSLDGLSANGVVGTINIGYDYSFGSVFLGAEAFGSLSSAELSASATDGVDTYALSAEAKESYGVAARLGARVNSSTGVYARVGWVNTNFEVAVSENGTTLAQDDTQDAIQYGLGLETLMTNAISLRAEYTINDYGDAGIIDGVGLSNSQVRAGLAYRF